jgi:hypothetical protein
MKKNNINKEERSKMKKENLENSQKGSGLFVFKNKNSQASLQLPKISFDGKRWVEPNQTWKGDSFYFTMVPKEAILVKTLISPDQEKENKMNEQKLLLDQPDQITQEGKIEHVTETENVTLNETTKKKKKTNENVKKEDLLMTEEPIAGVTIIRD